MIARDTTGRNWVFTLNNYTEDECHNVEALSNFDEILRIFVGKEVGEEGTPHLQGYISFNDSTTRAHVETLLGGRAWINRAHGGWKQNYDYCTKQHDILVCKGGPSNAVSDKMPQEALEDIKTLDPFQYMDKWPAIWFYRRKSVLDMMMDYAIQSASAWDGDLTSKNIWIWGAAGVGKSKWTYSLFRPQQQYRKNLNKWWDGYSILMHRIVIIEDIDPSRAQCLTPQIKIWSDRYPFLAECKGSSISVSPGRFFLVITSNYSIEECFPMAEDQAAIKRRFNTINVTRENIGMLDVLRPDISLLQ